MTEAAIEVAGETFLASSSGALLHARTQTLIVADLHFEKGSSFARHGALLPPYDTRATLKRLRALCVHCRPQAVVSLGDAFHDGEAETRMGEEDSPLLAELVRGRRWIWVLGNHDPAPPVRFDGEVVTEFALGRTVLRHEPTGERGEIAGHLHPCARVKGDLRTLRRRCFATDGGRLVLPAFGAYAGGLNLLDEAFEPWSAPPTAYVLGARGVYCVGIERLAADAVAPRRYA